MLRSLKDLEHYNVSAVDGHIGSVINFLLDDEQWVIRYLVLSTSNLCTGRQPLVSPISFREIEWSPRCFHVALTEAKVKGSPTADTGKPVSRRHERDFNRYYQYAPYWGCSGLWGMGDYPGLLTPEVSSKSRVEHFAPPDDVHVRSASDVRGFHVQGTDDTIGHIADFIVDDETWEIRHLVINTSHWWFGKKVLILRSSVNQINWANATVHVDFSRKSIKERPDWDACAVFNREHEMRLYDAYARRQYLDHGNGADEAPSSLHPG